MFESVDGEEPPPVPAGPVLAAALEGFDAEHASDYALVEAIKAYQRQLAHDRAAQLVLVHQLTSRFEIMVAGDAMLDGEGATLATDELAMALRVTTHAASTLVVRAGTLTDRLPEVLAAMATGSLDEAKAALIIDATAPLDAEVAVAVADEALDTAADLTTGQLRARLKRLVITCDPAGADARHRARCQDRRVWLFPEDDGMAILSVYGPAPEVQQIQGVLDAVAHAPRADDDDRGIDARRFDALHSIVTGQLSPPAVGGAVTVSDVALKAARAKGGSTQVTISIETLLGLDDEPATLRGYGPITAQMARELAAASDSWRRLLTDPASGALLDYGRTTYRPPAALDQHVRARDQTCRSPSCRLPADHVDLDHSIAYEDGGPTADYNLGGVCRRHHNGKTAGFFTLEQPSAGTFIWTTPTGHRYTVHPEPLGPVHTPPPPEQTPVPTPDLDPPF